jgi:hypothetical protein
LPQPPQFGADDERSASHPFVALPSQSAKPAAHTHVAGAMPLHTWFAMHALPHPPQSAALVSRFTHAMPHKVSPDPHALLHPVELQTGVVPVQAVPHAPQLAGSSADTVQSVAVDGQRKRPAAHSHVPALQTSNDPHARGHAPQCALSVVVSTSHPFAGSMSQSAKPALQPHIPIEQLWFAPHTRPHVPQWFGSVAVITSQPFAALLSQSAVPGAHTQAPPEQTRPVGQTRPHMPQLSESAAALTSQPLTTFESHSRNPRRQVDVHVPPLQVVPGHGMSQLPQLSALLSVLTHRLPQQVCPPVQAGEHVGGVSVGASTTSSASRASPASGVASTASAASPASAVIASASVATSERSAASSPSSDPSTTSIDPSMPSGPAS